MKLSEVLRIRAMIEKAASSLSDEQSAPYVHTKHLQWAQKIAAQQAAENE